MIKARATAKRDVLPLVQVTHQRKRDRTPVRREVIPPPFIPPVTMMRVRILQRISGSRHGNFDAGVVYELPICLATSWIQMGLAEEDKMIDGPDETK